LSRDSFTITYKVGDFLIKFFPPTVKYCKQISAI